ncbi:nephrin [Procambarus clarkii]|uniref:nephrin n=1 Tax=Procambarus clarkii TaxID=6728 RepID=UPI003744672F
MSPPPPLTVPPSGVSVVVNEAVNVVFNEAGFESSPTNDPSGRLVGPFKEGETIVLTCIAHGGSPVPSVVWYEGGRVLDAQMDSKSLGISSDSSKGIRGGRHMGSDPSTALLPTFKGKILRSFSLPNVRGEAFSAMGLLSDVRKVERKVNLPRTVKLAGTRKSHSKISRERLAKLSGSVVFPTASTGIVYNTLTLGPLNRSQLLMELTCQASNNNVTLPVKATITLDLNLSPLSVEIVPPGKGPLREGVEYEVKCVVAGGRPPPSITWWSGYQRVLQASDTSRYCWLGGSSPLGPVRKRLD